MLCKHDDRPGEHSFCIIQYFPIQVQKPLFPYRKVTILFPVFLHVCVSMLYYPTANTLSSMPLFKVSAPASQTRVEKYPPAFLPTKPTEVPACRGPKPAKHKADIMCVCTPLSRIHRFSRMKAGESIRAMINAGTTTTAELNLILPEGSSNLQLPESPRILFESISII